jgi:hypothetical protein
MADREFRPGVRLRDIEPAGEQILCREPANQIVCLMGRICQYRRRRHGRLQPKKRGPRNADEND